MERVVSFFKDHISFRHLTKVLIFIIFVISLPFISKLFTNKLEENKVVMCLRSFYKDLGFSKHLKLIKNVLSSSMIPKRKMTSNDKENRTQDSDKLIYSYLFFNNISDYNYYGNWTNVNNFDIFPEFENKIWGKISIRFTKKLNRNESFFPKIFQNDYIKAKFHLYDGIFKDKWFNFNFTINLPYDEKSNKIEIKETTVNFTYGEIMEKLYEGKSNFSLSGEFIKDEKKFILDVGNIKTAEYSTLKGILKLNGSIIEFISEISDDSYLFQKAWNYSVMVSLIGLVEIYYTIQLLYEVVDFTNVGTRISLITLAMNIIWNSIICTLNFFLSINFENFPYQFGIPSFIYFLLFSIFELRLLFYVWKSRYEQIYITDQNLFRSKLMRFYFFFYASLFISMMLLKQIFSNFLIFYIVFSATWIPQIILNFKTGAKDSLNFKYIQIVSLGKLFIPLYMKSCPNNFLELKPIYLKMSLITTTILIEIGILYMQRLFGPKNLIPSFLKKKTYQYYIEKKDIDKNNFNTECIICLEDLMKNSENKSSSYEINNQNTPTRNVKERINCKDFLESKKQQFYTYLKNLNMSKPYMITPCNHVFHSKCLELWIDKKLECPFCRRRIPQLE